MSNPLMGGRSQTLSPMANIQQFMQRFNQFRQNFQGNPQQQIQQLMNSGRISQDKYNWAYQQAQETQRQIQQIQQIMGYK